DHLRALLQRPQLDVLAVDVQDAAGEVAAERRVVRQRDALGAVLGRVPAAAGDLLLAARLPCARTRRVGEQALLGARLRTGAARGGSGLGGRRGGGLRLRLVLGLRLLAGGGRRRRRRILRRGRLGRQLLVGLALLQRRVVLGDLAK